jgi:Sec-independent protein secretion pathway component TatC
MKGSVIQKLLRLYPAKWRNEYGAELQELLYREPLRFSVILNIASSAVRQQLRFSNHPAGLARWLALMTAGVGAVFVFSMIVSIPLWSSITLPMAKALSQSGMPPRLIQDKPFESFAIIWLALPSLVTAFVGYPLILFLARVKLASTWTPQRKSWATAFVICSGGLFFLSGVGGFVGWQYGVTLTLRGVEPLVVLTSTTSVSACFARFARSTLEFGILLQVPVLALFISRMRRSAAPISNVT